MRGVVVGVLCVVLVCVSGCSVVGSLGLPGFGGVELLECDLPDGVSSTASPSSSSSSTATVSPSPTSADASSPSPASSSSPSSLSGAWGVVVGGVGNVVGARGVLDGAVGGVGDEELGELVFGDGAPAGDTAAALEGFDASSVFLGRLAGVVVGRAGAGVGVDGDVAQVVLARTGVAGSFGAWRGVGDIGAVIDRLNVGDEVVARSLACALRGELASGAGREVLDTVGVFYGEHGVPRGARVWCERWLVWRVGDVFASWMGESGGVFDGFVRVGLSSLVSEEGRVGFVRGVRGVVHERLWALEFKEGVSIEGQVADVGRGVGVVVAVVTQVGEAEGIDARQVAPSILAMDSHVQLELGRTSWEKEVMFNPTGDQVSLTTTVSDPEYVEIELGTFMARVLVEKGHAAGWPTKQYEKASEGFVEAVKEGRLDYSHVRRFQNESELLVKSLKFNEAFGQCCVLVSRRVSGGMNDVERVARSSNS